MDVKAPDSYQLVLDWLEVNPGVTLDEVIAGLHLTRYRALLCLNYGREHGTVRRYRPVPHGRLPYQWYRETGVSRVRRSPGG